MLTRKIPFYAAILSLLCGVIITLLLINKSNGGLHSKEQADNHAPTEAKADVNYKLSRQKGYQLIDPLLSVNPAAESDQLSGLKARIQNLIEDDKRQGLLSSASVYLCSFSQGEWIYINPDELYHPGSLMKVPMLITYLKAAESDAQLLSKKIFYDKPGRIPDQTFNGKQIEQGHAYTVKELMHYMIAYSDNNATNLLNQNSDRNILKKVFTDLNIPEPNLSDINYLISAKHYSEFLTVLYNASYLSRQSSEYAMELMCECDFKDGMLRDLPATLKVAHKFGEWGDARMNIHELHEAAIIYLQNKPYLLTVMAKGNASKELSMELSKISKLAYDHISASGN